MSLRIKSLGRGTVGNSADFTVLVAQVEANKALIVKNMRFVNNHTSNVTLELMLRRPKTPPTNPITYDDYYIAPININIPPGGAFIETDEITLETDDSIVGNASVTGVVDFVISGVEREQV